MKEVTSIEEVSSIAMIEDIKKLEDTMAEEGIAPMIKRTPKIEDEETLADIVSRGMPEVETPAPSEPINVLEDLSTEVEIEGIGTVSMPLDNTVKHKNFEKRSYPAATVTKNRSRVFDSGLKVIKTHNEKVVITVPIHISNVCNSLQRTVGSNEFSIVCKGHWNDDGTYSVGEDFEVPKQKVDGAAVDYDLEHLEELKLNGFNTVIHSHPFKSSNFSCSDDETINSHFECSVLYSVGDFPTATIAVIPIPGTKLIITGNPMIEGQNIVPASKSNNIEKKYNYVPPYNQYNLYGGGLCEYDDRDYDKYHNNNKKFSNPDDCENEYNYHINNKRKDPVRIANKNDMGFDDWDNRIYDYDTERDIIYKNGKPINRQSEKGSTRLPLNGCANTKTPSKIFRTDMVDQPSARANAMAAQRSNVFKTDASVNRGDVGSKQQKCVKKGR